MTKTCQNCWTENPSGAARCSCGFEFPQGGSAPPETAAIAPDTPPRREPKRRVGYVVLSVVGLIAAIFVRARVMPLYQDWRVEQSLQSLPFYQELKKQEPGVYQTVRDRIRLAVRQGKSGVAEARRIGAEAMGPILPKYVIRSSDEDVVAFFSASTAMIREVAARNPSDAFLFLFPGVSRQGAAPQVSAESTTAMMNALTGVMKSAASRPAQELDRVRAEAILKEKVIPEIVGEHGPALVSMSDPSAPGVDRAAVAKAAIALYDSVLRLPKEDAALVLRFLVVSGQPAA